MFIRNAWYVAAWADEIGETPLARRICNEPVVLFRDRQNRVAALLDMCCHRGAPLHMGKVVEEGLQCGYHGLIFDRSGACVRVPGQDAHPGTHPRAQLSRGGAGCVRVDLDGRSGQGRCIRRSCPGRTTTTRRTGRTSTRCIPSRPPPC